MSDTYGVTKTGFVKKRLDTIVDEIHTALSNDWGVNTKLNPKSYLNVLITDFADKIAELWEVAEESYLAKYPSSAEGLSLDFAAEYGGSTREQAAPTYFSIRCTGKNGLDIPEGTLLETQSDPKVMLKNYAKSSISVSSCCKVSFSILGAVSNTSVFRANINQSYAFSGYPLYQEVVSNAEEIADKSLRLLAWKSSFDSYCSEYRENNPNSELTDEELEAIFVEQHGEKPIVPEPIKSQSQSTLFGSLYYYQDNKGDYIFRDKISYDKSTGRMTIDFGDVNQEVILSSNLEPVEVSSINTFGTVEFGDIDIPYGFTDTDTFGDYEGENSVVPTVKIKSTVDGLDRVELLDGRISGRLMETDTEFRRSYTDKIFIRSRTMLESLTSAILQNVQNVTACVAYQNDTHVYQKHRPPHSVEVIVECDDSEQIYKEIATQILATKAAGIQTCNCLGLVYNPTGENADRFGFTHIPGLEEEIGQYAIEVPVIDDYGYEIPIRFSKPIVCPIEFTVYCYQHEGEAIAANTKDLIRAVIERNVNSLKIGESLIPAKFVYQLYQEVPGFDEFDVVISFTVDKYNFEYTVEDGQYVVSNLEDFLETEERTEVKSFVDVPDNTVCRVGDVEVIYNPTER